MSASSKAIKADSSQDAAVSVVGNPVAVALGGVECDARLLYWPGPSSVVVVTCSRGAESMLSAESVMEEIDAGCSALRSDDAEFPCPPTLREEWEDVVWPCELNKAVMPTDRSALRAP